MHESGSLRPPLDSEMLPSRMLNFNRADLFLNRELSWLEFNQRVLDEARNPDVPLRERLKFLSISSNNLDEFFMVRVAGILEQRNQGIVDAPPDGMRPRQQVEEIAKRAQRMYADMCDTFNTQLAPDLAEHGVVVIKPEVLSAREQQRLERFFFQKVFPILTPLAIDPGHPFPHVPNKSIHLILVMRSPSRDEAFGVVQVPRVLPRLVPVQSKKGDSCFVLLDDVIATHAGRMFRGFSLVGAWAFRVIRNFDLTIDEDEAEDLLEVIEKEVRRRDQGNAVRLAVQIGIPDNALSMLTAALGVDHSLAHVMKAPPALHDFAALGNCLPDLEELEDPPFTPVRLPPLLEIADLFDQIQKNDVLLHHPYESFDPVVEFIERAANDPQVLAIKQTVYRTSGDSPIVKALIRAAENGKQVAALVEIKARFDEVNNIHWAKTLEQSGVHVVYGLVGLKTHCKVTLVVRRELGKLRRYIHLGTGNYNPKTAKLYTDLSLFTSKSDFGEDATSLFNLLTSCTPPEHWKRFLVAPLGLHEAVLAMIDRERRHASEGKTSRIIAKMNSLVDPDVIQALYRASNAGVKVDLIVRGICCLRPGVEGLSENIRVRSIVDRFLEHSRVFYFENAGERDVYISSADWMPRNFHRRIEVMIPVDADHAKDRIVEEILGSALADTVKANILGPDGFYSPASQTETAHRSQTDLMLRARKARKKANKDDRVGGPFIVRPVRHRPSQLSAPIGTDDIDITPD